MDKVKLLVEIAEAVDEWPWGNEYKAGFIAGVSMMIKVLGGEIE